MSDIEKMLSDAADVCSNAIAQDEQMRREINALLKNNQTPYVLRLLSNELPGAAVLIRIEKEPT